MSVLEYHIHNPDEIINHSGLNQYSSGGSGNGELLRCIDDLRDEIAEIRGKTSCDQPVLHNSGEKGARSVVETTSLTTTGGGSQMMWSPGLSEVRGGHEGWRRQPMASGGAWTLLLRGLAVPAVHARRVRGRGGGGAWLSKWAQY